MGINLNKGLLAKIRAFFVPVDAEVLPTVDIAHMEPKTAIPAYSFDFDAGRKGIFKSGYTQKQVDSINAIIAECNKQGVPMPEQVAYILATAWHESRLEPISEWGGEKYLKAKPYYPYYGRGFSQLTWKENYQKEQDRLWIPLVDHPNLMLNIDTSANSHVYCMMTGRYTGRKLPDYINENKIDYVNARRVVNGTDRAQMIADYAQQFEGYVNIG